MPSCKLGELGHQEGQTSFYNWKWYYNVPGLLIWMLLIAVLLGFKANRKCQAYLIFIPLLIVNLLWVIFKNAMGFDSASAEIFNMLFDTLVLCIIILWLVADKLADRSRLVTFVLALLITAAVSLVGLFSCFEFEFSQETLMWLMLLGVMLFTLMISLAMAGWRCSRYYSAVRFMLNLGVWMPVVCSVNMMIFNMVTLFLTVPMGGSILLMLMQFFIVGLITGLCLYIITFPFMILAFKSSFYRERFFACFRLSSMATMEPNKNVTAVEEGNDGDHTAGYRV